MTRRREVWRLNTNERRRWSAGSNDVKTWRGSAGCRCRCRYKTRTLPSSLGIGYTEDGHATGTTRVGILKEKPRSRVCYTGHGGVLEGCVISISIRLTLVSLLVPLLVAMLKLGAVKVYFSGASLRPWPGFMDGRGWLLIFSAYSSNWPRWSGASIIFSDNDSMASLISASFMLGRPA